jgi:erythronate-4-phosphate dehydrogenase
MHILVDENIPYGVEAFATLGTVSTFHGRQLAHSDLVTTDLLIVRSITAVNASLLQNTSVKFVGTATIGTDHIDLEYLNHHNISFASAPGCNATSAAEYVVSALTILAQQQDFDLNKKIVGIIGCGNVGSRVRHKLQALGASCLVYDPPLQQIDNSQDFVDIATLQHADIITLHVPLTTSGKYPTQNLINAEFLSHLREDVILINTARGNVIDEIALSYRLLACPKMQVVLDVWRDEPRINPWLLARASLATPHIAGYSFDGKVRGTEMIYQAVCQFLNTQPQWQPQLPAAAIQLIGFSEQFEPEQALATAILSTYDVRRDDAKLRLMGQSSKPTHYFDQLRKNYPIRREFSSLTVQLPKIRAELAKPFETLGFKTF